MSVTTINRPADATYLVHSDDAWVVKNPKKWTDLPNAVIPLSLGHGTPAYGAILVATFSAEALCESADNNNVVSATVFFGDTQSEPASQNHRYVTARGGPEWSSHTFIRTARFSPDIDVRDVTARVKISGGDGCTAGIQNWVLKVERYNL